jgi:hypothetical protein
MVSMRTYIEAERVHHRDDVVDRRCETAEGAAAGHAANVKTPGIEGEVLHADAVAEDRAVRERRRRVDRDDADLLAALRYSAASAPVSVLLPEPALPVMPMVWARPECGKSARRYSRPSALSLSTRVRRCGRARGVHRSGNVRRGCPQAYFWTCS